jgi:outer membrane murein-binding lipoprotein Lpp
VRELHAPGRRWTYAHRWAIARLAACRAAMAIGFCCAAGSLSGCAVTNRMDRMNAHIEEMNDRMAQLNDRVENLSKAIEKLDETNKRLGDLRDQAGVMAKQLGSIEKVARKFGGGTSLEEVTQPTREPEPVIEQVIEPAVPLGQVGPALPEPASPKPASPDRSDSVPPSEASASIGEPALAPAHEIAEPPHVENKVGMRVITLR